MVPRDLKDRVQRQQQKQKQQHDQHARSRTYKRGDFVFIHDFRRGSSSSWSPDTIVQPSGGQSYQVQLSDGQIVRRHADHIRTRESDCEDVGLSEELEDVSPIPLSQPTANEHQSNLHSVIPRGSADHRIGFTLKGKRCGKQKLYTYTGLFTCN